MVYTNRELENRSAHGSKMCIRDRVKDHRTGYESGNVDDVMDGNLDGFITAYLKMQ